MQRMMQHRPHKPRGRNAAHIRHQLRATERAEWKAEARWDAASWRREVV